MIERDAAHRTPSFAVDKTLTRPSTNAGTLWNAHQKTTVAAKTRLATKIMSFTSPLPATRAMAADHTTRKTAMSNKAITQGLLDRNRSMGGYRLS